MPKPNRYIDRLASKVAIVTGAGTEGDGFGIGKAIAYWFAREGAKVCVVDMDMERAQDTVDLISTESGEAIAVQADVANEPEDQRAVEETIDRWGRVDILVNNAGIAEGGGTLDTLDMNQWERVVGVNLKAAVLLSKHAVPHMIAFGSGTIINIASISGLRANGSSAYGPSKAGLIALTRELSVMYGRDGIRANAIAPGHVYTPMAMRHLGEEARDVRRRVAPLGIEGDAWDVAGVALFLASDEARFLSGVCIAVDGGLTEMGPLVGHRFLSTDG